MNKTPVSNWQWLSINELLMPDWGMILDDRFTCVFRFRLDLPAYKGSVQLQMSSYLCLIGRGLSWEVNKCWHVDVLWESIHQFLMDINRFSSTSWSSEQYRSSVQQQQTDSSSHDYKTSQLSRLSCQYQKDYHTFSDSVLRGTGHRGGRHKAFIVICTVVARLHYRHCIELNCST